MKAVVIEKQGTMVLKEMTVPQTPMGFVRVKVKAAAICATDLEVLDGNIAAKYPLIPGHESLLLLVHWYWHLFPVPD